MFLSSYMEALGTEQVVLNGTNVVFDTDPDSLDVVGDGIMIDATGTVFTITRPGLYHVEWSVNMGTAQPPVLLGLFENGQGVSPLSNSAQEGNYSSGALINVGPGDIPYRISLHNFGGPMQLENPSIAGDTAASIRILKFADGPQ